MYNFVFWFFYRYFEKNQKLRSVFVATSIVGLSIVLHVTMLYCIARSLGLFSIPVSNAPFGTRKYYMISIAIAFFAALYFGYYKRNGPKILKTYNGKELWTVRSVGFIALFIILPLIMIFLLSREVM